MAFTQPPAHTGTGASDPSSKLLLWIFWIAFGGGFWVMRHFMLAEALAKPPKVAIPEAAMYPMLLAPLLASVAVRVLLLPRSTERPKVLVAMILGLALAQAITTFSIFLFPAQLDLCFPTTYALWAIYIPAFFRVGPVATTRDA